jgi:hypothetical protein
MKKQRTKVPEEIWKKFRPISESRVFAIRLRDGTVLNPVAISSQGELLGMVVGGWSGIEEFKKTIPQEDIVAVRVADGILGTFGLRPWKRR